MTSSFIFANNAASVLAANITNVAVSCQLQTGTGALFPNPGTGTQFAMTFTDAATGLVNEIVYVTARSGDVCTILRGQEGTAAVAWNAGDNADALITAGSLQYFQQQTDQGQCRLAVTSATVLTLAPYQGNQLWVNGGLISLPSAGITITNSGLVANTLYYVYVTSAGALALSTTGHVTNSVGVEVKSGDATQSLVGMIRTQASTPGQFVNSTTQRFCANWFNRARKSMTNTVASFSTASGTPVDLMASNHIEFLCWADGAVDVTFIGAGTNNNIGSSVRTAIAVDGFASGNEVTPELLLNAPVANGLTNVSIGAVGVTLAEGYHFATAAGYSGSNTASWSTMGIFAVTNI